MIANPEAACYNEHIAIIPRKKVIDYMTRDDLLRIGVISSTHGIRGEVKVFPTTDLPEQYETLESVFLDTGKELLTLELERVRYFKNRIIVKFKGYDNINDIEPYKGKDLLITREQAVPLEENEYFIADLIGCRAVTEEGRELGVLDDVLETGANDVFVVKKPDGKELLLPYIEECILDIDLEEKMITVHMMEGLE
jgi:16S rRNA processing protein RimM